VAYSRDGFGQELRTALLGPIGHGAVEGDLAGRHLDLDIGRVQHRIIGHPFADILEQALVRSHIALRPSAAVRPCGLRDIPALPARRDVAAAIIHSAQIRAGGMLAGIVVALSAVSGSEPKSGPEVACRTPSVASAFVGRPGFL
jgi:hypothetical protein